MKDFLSPQDLLPHQKSGPAGQSIYSTTNSSLPVYHYIASLSSEIRPISVVFISGFHRFLVPGF